MLQKYPTTNSHQNIDGRQQHWETNIDVEQWLESKIKGEGLRMIVCSLLMNMQGHSYFKVLHSWIHPCMWQWLAKKCYVGFKLIKTPKWGKYVTNIDSGYVICCKFIHKYVGMMHYTFVDQLILTFCNDWLPGQLFSAHFMLVSKTPKTGQIRCQMLWM